MHEDGFRLGFSFLLISFNHEIFRLFSQRLLQEVVNVRFYCHMAYGLFGNVYDLWLQQLLLKVRHELSLPPVVLHDSLIGVRV